jgi:RimJ/RimL family protein N-acetyltransferase
MRHDITLKGHAFSLRPVTLDDCGFMVSLRTDPSLSQFLHETSTDLAAQSVWIEHYFERAGDYYFIVENRALGTPEGTISIYNLDADRRTAEWGRWILRPKSLASMDCAMLIYRVAFNCLGLQSVYCRTLSINEKVVSFHTSCGLETIDTLPEEFNIRGRLYDAVKQCLTFDKWPAVDARLASLATRTARLANRGAKQ